MVVNIPASVTHTDPPEVRGPLRAWLQSTLIKAMEPSIPEKASQAWDIFGGSKESWQWPGLWKQIYPLIYKPIQMTSRLNG